MNWIGIITKLLTAVNVIVCVLIILLVLLQRPKNEGLGAAFGGDTASNLFGAQTTNVLATLTRWLGGTFLFLCLLIADYESKPDVGRRKAEKLVIEDKIDVAEGGYLSNVCLACMPVFEEHKLVFMIGVCLDTTITTSKCSRYVFRPFDYAPAQAVAFAPYMTSKLGKKWHIAFLDYAWGQSTRDAYAEQIKKNGGEVVSTTGIPLGTADMTPFISKISGNFDGLFGILFGAPAVTFANQAFDLGLTKKYRFAGDGAVAESTHLLALDVHLDLRRVRPKEQGNGPVQDDPETALPAGHLKQVVGPPDPPGRK